MKDLEGYSAFDLYNSTLDGTQPLKTDTGRVELFTWGTNRYVRPLLLSEYVLTSTPRNATLGLGDGDDRAHPDQVIVLPKEDAPEPEKQALDMRFTPIEVRQIAMSRLHTGE